MFEFLMIRHEFRRCLPQAPVLQSEMSNDFDRIFFDFWTLTQMDFFYLTQANFVGNSEKFCLTPNPGKFKQNFQLLTQLNSVKL